MLPVCSFNREVLSLQPQDSCWRVHLALLGYFAFFHFPQLINWFGFFFFLPGTVVKCNWCTVMFILCYIFSCHKKVLFFPEKLHKMLFCTSLPLTKQTGRFWRLDSVFHLFHLSICLASGMWSLANNAQPVQTIVNLSTANQQKEYLTQILYMVTSPAQDKLHIW